MSDSLKKNILPALVLVLVLIPALGPVHLRSAESTAPADRPLVYPPAPRGDQVDDYHGVKVEDPYRWLEEPDSPRTRAWIEAENRVTFGFLEKVAARPKIRERLTRLWDYEKFGVPLRRGARYFFTRNAGLQNQPVLYTLESLEAEPQVLLDPNPLAADGTVALAGWSPSEDGRLLAYALSSAGSDWLEWKVRDVETGKDLPDRLRWSKFSGASWTHDGKGFFYSRYDPPPPGAEYREANYYQKLCYHRVGTGQEEDPLVYHRPDEKEWGFDGEVTEDGRYLIVSVRKGTDPRRRIFFEDLAEPGTKVNPLIDRFEAAYRFVGNDGPIFWFLTDLQAPRGRIVSVDSRDPASPKELVPQAAEVLEAANVVNDRFIAVYLKDAHNVVRLFDLAGRPAGELGLPAALGTVSGFTGKRKDRETFFSFATFTSPAVIYRRDLDRGESEVFRQPRLEFHPEDYQTEQVFYRSRDGTRIPLFLSRRKGDRRDGPAPTLLYGYGGFKISLTPAFSPVNLAWMELGGLYAVPNIRGGGEYGEEWHQAGTRLRKQNVFDDFLAAAEFLVSAGHTSRKQLAISGGSNGGLLVGACLTQRPDLFAAALPAVGVMDMLRFQKFTIGWAWVSDYGSSDDPQEFRALRAYSPLHNLRPGVSYPATLVTTADHDDRVVPFHSFKFAAALQASQAGPAPVLIRIETRAGHGAGKPTSKSIEEAADRLSFLMKVLGMEGPPNQGPR